MTRFPDVSGSNLSGTTYHLPDDFDGVVNLVFVAFDQFQQRDVDSWTELAAHLRATYPGLHEYELPVVGNMPFWNRMLLDHWMRTGIPDPAVRDRTITLYIDVNRFLRALDLPDARRIYTLLVDRRGQVRHVISGPYTPENGLALQTALAKLLPQGDFDPQSTEHHL